MSLMPKRNRKGEGSVRYREDLGVYEVRLTVGEAEELLLPRSQEPGERAEGGAFAPQARPGLRPHPR